MALERGVHGHDRACFSHAALITIEINICLPWRSFLLSHACSVQTGLWLLIEVGTHSKSVL